MKTYERAEITYNFIGHQHDMWHIGTMSGLLLVCRDGLCSGCDRSWNLRAKTFWKKSYGCDGLYMRRRVSGIFYFTCRNHGHIL